MKNYLLVFFIVIDNVFFSKVLTRTTTRGEKGEQLIIKRVEPGDEGELTILYQLSFSIHLIANHNNV